MDCMLMDNKKSNFSISSNKNSMAGEKITGKEMEVKKNIKENKNKNIKESENIKKFYKRYVVIGFFVVGILGTLFHFVYDWSGQLWLVGLFVPVNESTWEHMKLLFIPMLIYIMFGYLYIKRRGFVQSKKYEETNRSNNTKINKDIYRYNKEKSQKNNINGYKEMHRANNSKVSKKEYKDNCNKEITEKINDAQEKNNELHRIVYTGLLGNMVGTWSIPFLFYGYKGILGFEVAWVDISTFFIAVFIAFALQYHVLMYSYKKQTQNCGKTLLIVNLVQLCAFVLLTYRPLNLGIFISPV